MPYYEIKLAGKWKPFDSKVGQAIAAAEARGAKQYHFESHGKKYIVDLVQMLQKSLPGGKARPIRDKHAFKPKTPAKGTHKGSAIHVHPDPGMKIVTVPEPAGGWPAPGSRVAFQSGGQKFALTVSEAHIGQRFVQVQVPAAGPGAPAPSAPPAPVAPAAPAPDKDDGKTSIGFGTAIKAGLMTGVLAVGALLAADVIDAKDLADAGKDALDAAGDVAADVGEALEPVLDDAGAVLVDAADDIADALDGLL